MMRWIQDKTFRHRIRYWIDLLEVKKLIRAYSVVQNEDFDTAWEEWLDKVESDEDREPYTIKFG